MTGSYRILHGKLPAFVQDGCPIPSARAIGLDTSGYEIDAYFAADEDPRILLNVVLTDLDGTQLADDT